MPPEGFFSCLFSACAAVVGVLLALAATVRAADAPLPDPADVKSLAIHPAKVALTGSDDAAQLVVTATLTDGRQVDLTHDVNYAVADGKAATVLATGRVLPRVNGTTEIVATFGDKSARVPVETRNMGENLPLNFANQVVPVFTKLGCNCGGCHGKLAGQNGFRLSLLGFEPDLDFMTLVKEGRGRRLFPANPDASLFLMKATGRVAARRRQEDGAGLATSTSSSAAGSPPACRRATRRTRPSRRSASSPNTAS